MRGRVRWVGSAVHPVLVVFSLGLLTLSVIFDLAGLLARRAVWTRVALWDLQLGLAGGAATGVFALASVAATPAASGARRLAVAQLVAHLGALALFGGALWLRRAERDPFPDPSQVVLSAAGLGLGALAAWFAAELAGRLER